MLGPSRRILSKSHIAIPLSLSFKYSNFSTGSDSPVNEDCPTNKSLHEITLTSAGIISPADKYRISPGTTSAISISFASSPSLFTKVVVLTMALSLFVASFDFFSWKNCSKALTVTIVKITITAVKLLFSALGIITSVKVDTIANIIKTILKGFINDFNKSIIHNVSFSCVTSFLPNFSLLASTILFDNPFILVFNSLNNSDLDILPNVISLSVNTLSFNIFLSSLLNPSTYHLKKATRN